MPPHTPPNWIIIAEQATKETDPKKLLVLIEQLTQALDEHSEAKSQRREP